MRPRLRAVLLLIVLLPYILPLSGGTGGSLFAGVTNTTEGQTSHDILSAREEQSRIFTAPVSMSGPLLPIKFIAAHTQKILEQNLWLCEVKYTENNDLSLNHPIIIYKISLSVHTSDG